jgi:catechol 2,3-dioxygenase-like lactoylglutathione lyase family enzyme
MSTLLYSGEQPMTFNGLWGLRHKVADIDRATEFYVQQLGFRLVHQTPLHACQLSSGALNLTLTSAEASECASMSDVCDRGSKGRSHIVLHVQDLASRMENLKRAGMVFAKEMEVSPIGKHVQLEDADGNRIELFEPHTLLFPLHPRIESRRQFVNEWLVPILISLLIVGLFLGAGAFVLLVPK